MSGFGFRIPKLIKLDRTEPIQPKIKPSIKKILKKKNFSPTLSHCQIAAARELFLLLLLLRMS
jgi:hypothetical protein